MVSYNITRVLGLFFFFFFGDRCLDAWGLRNRNPRLGSHRSFSQVNLGGIREHTGIGKTLIPNPYIYTMSSINIERDMFLQFASTFLRHIVPAIGVV